ncbi:hypothetical protein CIHG_04507 [Coccidioides immitis H538.4]|uniref:Uncharacterized protein n=1 Tax=Coccidioides immitis H538.4 TaxID=396776 RepID=A0A0J8UH20_COCIT|nr:hypothetical protein CIHG_04507 [Coccidioides immitis H538.4]
MSRATTSVAMKQSRGGRAAEVAGWCLRGQKCMRQGANRGFGPVTPPASNQLDNGESSDNTNRTTIFSIVIRNLCPKGRWAGYSASQNVPRERRKHSCLRFASAIPIREQASGYIFSSSSGLMLGGTGGDGAGLSRSDDIGLRYPSGDGVVGRTDLERFSRAFQRLPDSQPFSGSGIGFAIRSVGRVICIGATVPSKDDESREDSFKIAFGDVLSGSSTVSRSVGFLYQNRHFYPGLPFHT